MTRFVYLCDTHFGADGRGYHQLKAYPDQLPQILAALGDWIKEEGDIDFVLHGGDMINDGTEEQIDKAVEMFQLPVPIYLCLGNHDLARPESVFYWLKKGLPFFMGGQLNYLIASEDCAIHVLPNHWGDTPYYWQKENAQTPHLLPEQFAHFKQQYQECQGRIQIVLTHSPILGLPPEQTGMAEVYHAPDSRFTESILTRLKGRPDLLCVLGAHNHLNMQVQMQGIRFVTASALVEVPFEFKVFQCNGDRLSMETISLGDRLPWDLYQDPAKHFVRGNETIRNFVAIRKDREEQPLQK